MDGDKEKLYIINQLKIWYEGVIFQGKRLHVVLYQLQNQFNSKNQDSESGIVSERNNLSDVFRIESYFFIMALSKSINYIKMSIKYVALFSSVLEEIEKIASFIDIKDLRDMNVHDDEYIMRIGRKQNDFFSFDGIVQADAISIIVSEEGIKLGNKVNVTKILEKYKELSTMVYENCDIITQRLFVSY